jgi:hypothetical protein
MGRSSRFGCCVVALCVPLLTGCGEKEEVVFESPIYSRGESSTESSPSGQEETEKKAPQIPPEIRDMLEDMEQTLKPGPSRKAARPDLVIASDNLVNDNGFEQSTESVWSLSEEPNASLDGAVAYNGSRSLRLDAQEATASVMQRIAPVAPGPRYLLRSFVRRTGARVEARVAVEDALQGPSAFSESFSPESQTTEWTLVSGEFTVARGTSSLNLVLAASPSGEGEGTSSAWFDRVELLELHNPDTVNRLRDGGFEQGMGGVEYWFDMPRGEGVRTVETDAAEGKICLEVTRPNNENLFAYQLVNVEHDRKYVVLGQAKCRNVRGEVRLEAVDAKGGSESYLVSAPGISGTVGWTPLSLVFEVPKGINQLRVFLRRIATNDATGDLCTVWFDDYQMYRLAP